MKRKQSICMIVVAALCALAMFAAPVYVNAGPNHGLTSVASHPDLSGIASVTVLVVNDGNSNTNQTAAFTTALTNLAVDYDVVSSSSTTGIPATMTDYAAVLYAGIPSTGAEADQLVAYLNDGGRLLVADNDFGYFMSSSTLCAQYFQATYISDVGSDGPIEGVDIMEGIDLDIASDPFPDSFSIGPDAVGIFANTSPRSQWAGSRIERNGYRAIYLAWDFHHAGGDTVGDQVETDIVEAALAWLVGTGTGPTIIPDTGDPNERTCNPQSYTDLGNGIVRDNVTGLEWMQATAPGTYSWLQALDYADDLNDNNTFGYDDWRVPSIEDLSSIVDAGRYDPAIEPVFSAEDSAYWSSTSIAINTGNAWGVSFANGQMNGYGKGGRNLVRATRGGPYGPFGDFSSNNDGTITDNATGFMWQQCGYGQTWDGDNCTGSYGTLTWQQALDYVQDLNDANYLGYTDWRLPTRNELQSLVDFSIYDPATTFPNTVADAYWSSTTNAGNSDNAWYVDFLLGNVLQSIKSIFCYVRAVRGGACWIDDAECLADGDCPDDGLYCTGDPVCDNGTCGYTGDPCLGDNATPLCDEDLDECVECLFDGDCADTEICRDTVCMPGCELFVKHKRIRSDKLTKPRRVALKISSADEFFDVFGLIDIEPFAWDKVNFNQKKNRMIIRAIVPAGLAPGVYPISVGDCFGEVVVE